MKKLCLAVALMAFIALPLSSLAAENGAALYKAKCALCHAANGEGKAATKIPAVKGTSMTVEQIVDYISKGETGKKAPHAKPISGLNAEQAKAVAEFVKSLK